MSDNTLTPDDLGKAALKRVQELFEAEKAAMRAAGARREEVLRDTIITQGHQLRLLQDNLDAAATREQGLERERLKLEGDMSVFAQKNSDLLIEVGRRREGLYAAKNLLAVIHRDDGRHTEKVGFMKSCQDAAEVRHQLVKTIHEAPHGALCKQGIGGLYDPKAKCTCWKKELDV